MKRTTLSLAIFCASALAPLHAESPTGASAAQQPSLQQIAMLFFKQYDGNGDGAVTRREFLTPSMNQFDYIDRNGDGAVDIQEVNSFVQMMTQQRPQPTK